MDAFWMGRPTQAGVILGMAIPVFIHNVKYHFTTVDAYGDGAIDAWGFLDRPLFHAKVRTGGVATQPPREANSAIYDLGWAAVTDGNWLLTPGDILERVEDAIRELNPRARIFSTCRGPTSSFAAK